MAWILIQYWVKLAYIKLIDDICHDLNKEYVKHLFILLIVCVTISSSFFVSVFAVSLFLLILKQL